MQINEAIEEFRTTHLGKNWKWRDGQEHTITQIIETYLDGKIDTIILDAPTGSGKSVIAMAASWILTKLEKTGYLITSEKALQDQYEDDLQEFNLNWGMVKGVDNYICHINNQKFSLGECKMKNKVPASMECAPDCAYLVKRTAAILSHVSVLSYAYWLIQRNYVERTMASRGQPAPFPKRDFVFFDEAHRTSDIVQSHFAPIVRETLQQRLHDLSMFLKNQTFIDKSLHNDKEVEMLVNKLKRTNDKKEIFELSKQIEHIFGSFASITTDVQTTIKRRFPKTVPEKWQKHLGTLEWIKDSHCKFEDFNENIETIGAENIIKSSDDNGTTLRCLKEGYIIDRYLLQQAAFKIFMSATIGDPQKFMKINNIKNAKYLRMGNYFDFSKSPIFFMPNLKLNYQNKEKNFPKAAKIVDFLLEKVHPNEKGIIHTGSYEFSNKLYVHTAHKKRIIFYKGSDEKAAAIKEFENSDNLVLVGPSLLEGLDMKGDSSRFQIFLKTPFLSLGDPFIKAQLEKSQDWYNQKTIVKILQGTGRSIRYDGDYAVTYFLDSTILRLFKMDKMFPEYFKKRLKNIKEVFDKHL